MDVLRWFRNAPGGLQIRIPGNMKAPPSADLDIIDGSDNILVRLFGATAAITAFATGAQTSAVQLNPGVNRVTTCATAGDSVKLPAAVKGRAVSVIHKGAADMDIFPASGEFINALAVNLAIRIPTGSVADFFCGVDGTWEVNVPRRDAKYTADATVGATTAVAGILTGARHVQAGYTALGAAALTTRTAAQMIADGFYNVGDSYVLEITNTSGGTITLTAGSGITLTGTMTIATNSTRRFNVVIVSTSAVTIQSTGVGTIS